MRRGQLQAPRSAGLLERALAYLVDAALTFLLWGLAVLAITRGDPDRLTGEPTAALLAGLVFLLVPFLYFTLAEGWWASTPGKRLIGLSLETPAGGAPGLYASLVRNTLRLAWALGPVGPLLLALDVILIQLRGDSGRLGDVAAGTRVVSRGDGVFSVERAP